MTNTTQHGILICLAHPDDESFGSGGTMAYYGKQGVPVTLVCATKGEVGEISDPELATPETLAQVRERELRCACQRLGVDAPIFLGYRDSGMADTPDNAHPKAFMNVPADEVVSRLVKIIRRLQPVIVITFDPSGGYGHPDHIAIHKHTLEAVSAAADPTRYPEQGGEAWLTNRLLYAVIRRSLFTEMRDKMIAAGLDTSDLDRFEENPHLGWPDDQVDITVNVAATVEAKWSALHCHRTQFGNDNPFNRLPDDMMKQMMSQEYFYQAWPEHESQLHLSGLFEGL